MDLVRLKIQSELDGEPMHYNVTVSKKVAENFAKIMKENPELPQPEALGKAKEVAKVG
ncbi:hypothetical protein OU798_04460 [Prolixibacteraceae bacterium Z1-6]|uniref:Uncharacterized protein n=1 Tax=Draconibacterium aestuarii TaxID=2998507 RepID=A0A9X3J3Q0_9BACT|nr:hypothetical protein [Prolixibacteraceae bacterium Z1-6]